MLDAFFAMHNPVQPYRGDRRPGVSSREQYRSVIFTHTEDQEREADDRVSTLEASDAYPNGIATEVLPAPPFWRAEERISSTSRSAT